LQSKKHLENNRAYKQDYQISTVTFYLLKTNKNSVFDWCSNLLFAKNKQTVCERLCVNKSLLNTFQKLW